MSRPGGTDGWVRACRLADLDEDQPVHVDIGQYPVCLVRAGGAVYALRDDRTHQAVPLSAGGAIECWLHGSRFDLATGRVLSPPATRPPSSLSGPTAGTSSCAWAMAGASQQDSAAGSGGPVSHRVG
jgi:3-phenylpropionate/trans-cinnamate dioxygenase ferredoxin subunit